MSLRWLWLLAICCCTAPAAGETLWVAADQATARAPTMLWGRKAGLLEDGALGEFLVPAVYVTEDETLPTCFAEFRIQVPRAGDYYFWARLRYPLGVRESFALTPRTGTPDEQPPRPLGDSGADVAAWHWDSQGAGPDGRPGTGPKLQLSLAAGEFVFRVQPRQTHATVFRPLRWRQAEPAFNPRLNLLCLTTDANYVPNDADACQALGLRPSPVAPTAQATAPSRPPPGYRGGATAWPPLSPDDWRAQGKQPVPDWLRCPRFYTKDPWREQLVTARPGQIGSLVRQVAASHGNALRLGVFWGGEAFFPSRVAPTAPGLGNLDYLREALDAARPLGIRVVAYLNPNALYQEHPLFAECAVRGPDGQIGQTPAYGFRSLDCRYACVNHPRYRQFLLDVLREIFSEYRPDGLYVDGLTPHVCFCEHCRQRYREAFHADLPVEKLARYSPGGVVWSEMTSRPQPVGDPQDPDAQHLTQLMHRSLVEITTDFTRTVKSLCPAAAVMYHSYPKPETLPCYDGTLTEIYTAGVWVHKAWKFGELASYSNVFPIPVLFNIYLHEHGSEAEARYKAVQGLANGVFPNFWSTPGMAEIFRRLQSATPYFDFGRSRPVRFLALPRTIHDCNAFNTGAYSALLRGGLPITTLHLADFQQRLDGVQVLVLPNVALTSQQADAVRQFVRAGGGLIATHETSLQDPDQGRRPDFALADVLGVHFDCVLPAAEGPVRWAAPPTAAPFACDQPLGHQGVPLSVRPDGATVVAWLRTGNQADPERPAILTHEFGQGRVVYLPGRFEARQCQQPAPDVERLFADAVRWVGRDRAPVHILPAGHVGVTLVDQPERRIVHLVNHRRDTLYRDDRVEPVRDLTVRVRLPAGRRATRVHRAWNPAELKFEQQADWVTARIDSLDEYEVLVLETGT